MKASSKFPDFLKTRACDLAAVGTQRVEKTKFRGQGIKNELEYGVYFPVERDVPKVVLVNSSGGDIMQKFRFCGTVWLLIAVFVASGNIAAASSFLFSKVPQSEVNAEYVQQASQIMGSLYAKWQNGEFEPVGDEFTPEMQKGLTPELQTQTFEQISTTFGDFRGMAFVEALTARFLIPRGNVYRFKATYSRTSEQPEIRVVFDSNGKISGLWLKPWRDELQ